MARTDTINAANVANEVGVVFPAANGGHRAHRLAVKDATLQAAALSVVASGAVGHLDVVIDTSLGANAWEGRDRAMARTPEQMLSDARIADTRRHPFTTVGQTPWPYGGQLQ